MPLLAGSTDTMSTSQAKPSNAAFDDPATLVAVDRATAELRRGGPVVLQSARDGAFLVLAAETIEDACLARLRAAAAGDLQLVLTAQRTAALGLTSAGRQVASLLLPPR